MAIYLSFFSISIFLAWLSDKVIRSQRSYVLLTLFAILTLFSGLRGMVGSDTANYLEIYNSLIGAGLFEPGTVKIEPGFYLITFVHSNIFQQEWLYLLTISILQCILLYSITAKSSDSFLFLLFYILVFYLNFHFNTLRAGFASLFLLLALVNQGKRSGAYFGIALMFHISVLAFVPLFFSKLGKKYFILSIVAFFVLSAYFFYKFEYIIDKLIGYIDYLDGSAEGFTIFNSIEILAILAALLLIRSPNKLYIYSGLMLVIFIVIRSFLPIFYRLVIMALFVFSYFLVEELAKRSWSSITSILFCSLFLVKSYSSVSRIFNEEEILRDRISKGETHLYKGLETMYLPYEFYWQDPYKD